MSRPTLRVDQPAPEMSPGMTVASRKASSKDATAYEDMLHVLLERAQQRCKNSAQKSSLQRKFEEVEDRVIVKAPAASLADSDAAKQIYSNITERISQFAGHSAGLMKILDEISNIHPFVRVAVVAFEFAVKLELKRKDNNAKVMSLYVQMGDMLSALIPLQHVRDTEDIGKDKMVVQNTLSPLMLQIADDIIDCGNACDAYTKKRAVAKVLKSYIYEQRLAEYGDLFAKHHKSLCLAIDVNTTMGIAELKGMVSAVDINVNILLALFKDLTLPSERDLAQRVKQYGGYEACLKDDNHLEELVRMEARSQQGSAGGGGKRQSRGASDELNLVYNMKKDLQEELKESLDSNLQHYLNKLDASKEDIIGAVRAQMHGESAWVVSQVAIMQTRGAHEHVVEEDIVHLWKDMHWRNSVKSHHFTLALRDHLIEKYRGGPGHGNIHSAQYSASEPPSRASVVSHTQRAVPSEDLGIAVAEKLLMAPKRDVDDDQWAINAFSMLTVQPISEAFDDDGTGFITTREVNLFTLSRPKGWSLLRWLLYWGEGWYESLSNYQHKILCVMQEMFSTLSDLHPANRGVVDYYLDNTAFKRVELLLRGLNTSRSIAHESVIGRLREYTRTVEDRLQKRLEKVGYDIDATNTLEVVKGRGRIERYLFPLLYLLLRHHLDIIKLGRVSGHMLNGTALTAASQSLYQLTAAVDERVTKLTAIMRQSRTDPGTRMTTYAFGMFQYIDADEYHFLENHVMDNLLQYQYLDEDEDEDKCIDSVADDPVLQKAIIPRDLELSVDFTSWTAASADTGASGTWTGICTYNGGIHFGWMSGLINISLNLNDDGIVTGTGRCALADCTVDGTYETDEMGLTTLQLSIVFEAAPGVSPTASCTLSYAGEYLDGTTTLSGSWTNVPGDVMADAFQLVRTPVDVYRFRHCIDSEGRSSPTLWRFAREAVLHRVRRQKLCKEYVFQHLLDWVVYVDLHVRALVSRRAVLFTALFAPVAFSPAEEANLKRLHASVSPEHARFLLGVAFRPWQLHVHMNAVCDGCSRLIVTERYMCLQCTRDDLKNQIDLCATCRDQTPMNGIFTHKSSHTLIRLSFFLHVPFKKIVYDDARAALERVIRIRNGLGGFTLRSSDVTTASSTDSLGKLLPECVACSKSVTLPCWYCSSCHADSRPPKDVFTCEDCRSWKHDPHHVWILIKEESLRPEVSTVEMLLEALADQQKEMSDRMEMLERKLGMVDGMETVARKLDMLLAGQQNE